MKIGYMGERSYRAVIEHSKEITLAINEETEGVIVESALTEPPPDLLALNTCTGVRVMALNEEIRDNFNEVHGLSGGYPIVYLYGLLSPDGPSDFIEMTHSTRFLTGDIGPEVLFCQGSAVACDDSVYMAVPGLRGLINNLIDIGYRGEIAFGITADFKISAIQYGHLTLGFTLYTELSKHSPQSNYEWALGHGIGGKVHNKCTSIATLLSYPPFPYPVDKPMSVRAPNIAEKHLYRIQEGMHEIAYAAAWGDDVHEAKRRVRKTIDNCRNYNKDIQHRIDYGHKQRFLITPEVWRELGGTEPTAGQLITS